MPERTVVLDRDDMRRTLVRIAHEIVEKNPPGPQGGAHDRHRDRRHPPPRRGPRAAAAGADERAARAAGPARLRRHQLLPRRPATAARPSAPIVHATQLDFPIDGRTIVIVDDVLYTGRTVRSAIDQIFDYGRPAKVQLARPRRPRPPRAPDPARLRRQEHADRAGAAGQRPRRGDRRLRGGDDRTARAQTEARMSAT